MTADKHRTLLIKTRTYALVPDKFLFPDDNKEIFKSLQRFPKENPHWQVEVVEHDGKEYILESINETAFDTNERPIHEFVEDARGIQESSMAYFEGKNGRTIAVRATSRGFVSICDYRDNKEIFDTSDIIFITNGRRHDLGVPYEEENELDEEQWDDDFDDYDSKCEELEKDQYGNPLKSITWANGKILHYRIYEYTYAEKE